eukprot:gene21869-27944_t
MNVPVSRKLETDIRKAAYTLYNFTKDDPLPGQGKDGIPKELIKLAKGIVFVTLLKAGFLFTGRVGTGLVIAKLSDGSWSAPSAIMMSGMGWGFQAGGELTDVILILTSQDSVNAFCSKAQISVGTELAVSLGPVGRSAGGDVSAGSKGASAAFSYAHSKGLFFGISLEATVIACRPDINRQFYGMEITPTLLLNGVQPRPKAAEPLYKALDDIMSAVDDGHGYRPTSRVVDDDEEGFTSFNSAAHSMAYNHFNGENDDEVGEGHDQRNISSSTGVKPVSPIDREIRGQNSGHGWDEGEAVDYRSHERDPRLRTMDGENADLVRARDRASKQRSQQLQQQHEKEISDRGSFTSFSNMLSSGGTGSRKKATNPTGSDHATLEAELDSLLRDEGRWDDERDGEEEVVEVTFEVAPKKEAVKKNKSGSTTNNVDKKVETHSLPSKKAHNQATKPISTESDVNVWNFTDEARRRKVQLEAEKTFHSADEFYDDKLSDSHHQEEDAAANDLNSSNRTNIYEEIRF